MFFPNPSYLLRLLLIDEYALKILVFMLGEESIAQLKDFQFVYTLCSIRRQILFTNFVWYELRRYHHGYK